MKASDIAAKLRKQIWEVDRIRVGGCRFPLTELHVTSAEMAAIHDQADNLGCAEQLFDPHLCGLPVVADLVELTPA